MMRLERAAYVALGALITAAVFGARGLLPHTWTSARVVPGTTSNEEVSITVHPSPAAAAAPGEPALVTHEGLVALARRDPSFAPLLPPWMLEDADSVALLGPPVGHAGDLRRFAAKMRAARAGGRPLRVTVLGGSISACVLLDDPGAECWAARVARWFLTRARVGVALRNSAVRATSSSFAAQCLSSLVADDADFVFVEYTANDGYHGNKVDPAALCAGNATAPRLDGMSRLDTPVNRGLERLIRKLLRLPGAPVVVLVQWYTSALSRYFLQEAHFWQTAERDSATLAGYYDVASASARNTFYHLHAAGAGVAGARNESAALVDHVHPNALGHAHLAYPVIFYLEQALRLASPAEPEPAEPEPAGGVRAAGPARLPPPMFPGNHDFATFCRAGAALRALASLQQGWEWEPGDKAGFITHAGLPAGDLVLAFDLAGAPAGASAQLGLGVLVSNRSEMGAAHGRCSGGCACAAPWEIDGRSGNPGSQQHIRYHALRVLDPGAACAVSLRRAPAAGADAAGGGYFRVMSLSYGEQPLTYLADSGWHF